jgi:hypothetical protein
MKGILPDEILRRDKAPLAGDPQVIMLKKHGLPPLSRNSLISRYVDQSKIPDALTGEGAMYPLVNVYILDHWLKCARQGARLAEGDILQ